MKLHTIIALFFALISLLALTFWLGQAYQAHEHPSTRTVITRTATITWNPR